jgi:hypothetical protein
MSHTNMMDRMGMSMTEQDPIGFPYPHVPKFEEAKQISDVGIMMEERLCSMEQGMKSHHQPMQKQFELNGRRATMSFIPPIQEVPENDRIATLLPMHEYLNGLKRGITEPMSNTNMMQGMKSNYQPMQKQLEGTEDSRRRVSAPLLPPIQEVERNDRRARASMPPMPDFHHSHDYRNVDTQFWNNESNLKDLKEMMLEMGVIAHHEKTKQAQNQQQGQLQHEHEREKDDDDELSRFFETFAKSLSPPIPSHPPSPIIELDYSIVRPSQDDLIPAPIPSSSSAPFAELDDFSVSGIFSQRSNMGMR